MLRIRWTSTTFLDVQKPIACVRMMRRKAPPPGKPPILPPSKQTRYQVVHVPWMKPEDVKELLWRRHAYNHAVVSIREQFKRELQAKVDSGEGIALLKKQELEEFNLILQANSEENEKLARQR
uniref:Small ribosomal subunit protein mS26 n=1 Tax=Plectus sambesii TaxID=2011161 RepID=A0A914V5X0_9BILA